jgi:hypothetical protein
LDLCGRRRAFEHRETHGSTIWRFRRSSSNRAVRGRMATSSHSTAGYGMSY